MSNVHAINLVAGPLHDEVNAITNGFHDQSIPVVEAYKRLRAIQIREGAKHPYPDCDDAGRIVREYKFQNLRNRILQVFASHNWYEMNKELIRLRDEFPDNQYDTDCYY